MCTPIGGRAGNRAGVSPVWRSYVTKGSYRPTADTDPKLCSQYRPHRRQAGSHRNTTSLQVCAVPVGAALAGDGPRSGPGYRFPLWVVSRHSRLRQTRIDCGQLWITPLPFIFASLEHPGSMPWQCDRNQGSQQNKRCGDPQAGSEPISLEHPTGKQRTDQPP